MTQSSKELEELIKELKVRKLIGFQEDGGIYLAMFILFDRKRICEPIRKAMNTKWPDADDRWSICNSLIEAIEKTLKNSGLEAKDGK